VSGKHSAGEKQLKAAHGAHPTYLPASIT